MCFFGIHTVYFRQEGSYEVVDTAVGPDKILLARKLLMLSAQRNAAYIEILFI